MKQRKGHGKRQKTVASVGQGFRTTAMDSPNGGNMSKFGASTPSPPSSGNCKLNVKCYGCGKNGHYINRCPEKMSCFENMSKFGASTPSPPSSGNCKLNVKCYGCGKNGHYINRCPEKMSFECGKNGHLQKNCPEKMKRFQHVKCFECGKNGHYQDKCPEKLCFECGRNEHHQNKYPEKMSCFECGKNGHHHRRCPEKMTCFKCGMTGHYQNKCPEKSSSPPTQAYDVLPTTTTTNLEGGNMPKLGAIAILALPLTPGNHNLDDLKCCEFGKNRHFQNQCPNDKGSVSTQDYTVAPNIASTNVEANKRRIRWVNECTDQVGTSTISPELETSTCPLTATCSCGTSTSVSEQPLGTSAFDNTTPFGRSPVSEQQPTMGEFGLASNQSELFGNSNTTCAKTAFDASTPCRSASVITNPKVAGQSDTCAFDTASSMDALCCSTSTAVFGIQSSSSLPQACKNLSASCDVPPIPVVGFEFVPQPSVQAFGSPSNHSSPFGGNKNIGFSAIFGAPSPSAFDAGAASSLVFGQSCTPAFGTASNKPASFSSTSACDSQNISSLCGSPSTPALGSGCCTPAFKCGAMGHKSYECPSSEEKKGSKCSLCKKVGHVIKDCLKLVKDDQAQLNALGDPASSSAAALQDKGKSPAVLGGTSGFAQQSTTRAVGLTLSQSSPLVNHHAIGSNTSFAVPSQYAFGTPTTTVFGQSSTLMGKAGSMPALFGSTATSSSTSAFGSQSNMSYLFRTSSNSFGGVSSALFTFGCQTTSAETQTTAPENQTTTAENQTTAPENQTTTPENQSVTNDQQKSIEIPYSSTEDICGKSVSILDKSIFKDKHNEELRQEKYHDSKGCDQEQAQAWGQARSNPFALTNTTSSFDQSPRTKTPQSPVVTSENNERSGDTPYKATKTSVWWDIENCQVPRGSDTYHIAQNISSALADAGYKGAVTISAYGDTHRIPKAVQQALSSTGIALNHVPAGVKDASDKKILVDMLFWAVDNPPPANYLLISGDRDFSNALHQLRLRRYNILLAHAPHVSQALVAAAKKVWEWGSLLSGGPPLPNLELGVKTLGPNRLRWKNSNARETLKIFGVQQSNEDCDIQSKIHSSFPRLSMPETDEITGSKRARTSSPSHEIICAKRPRDLVDSPEQMPLRSMLHFDHEKVSYDTQPFKFSFVPANNRPSQNTNNCSSIAEANQQHIMLGPPHLLSMHKPPQMYNDNQNNGCQVHSSEVQPNIRHVLDALIELKANKITPSEENISNCLQYGMGKRSVNVKTALNHACENFLLIKYNLSNGASIYLGKNEKLWECVNVFDIHDKHSEATWNAVRNFLSSEDGRSAISSTECRYHAATVLKEACLHHFALGDVLQLLTALIRFRKWIVPALSGWQPLSFTL